MNNNIDNLDVIEVKINDDEISEKTTCSKCNKNIKASYVDKLKGFLNGKKPEKCINCNKIFCSDCYHNQIIYNNDFSKKGYFCLDCKKAEETHEDMDIFNLPLTKLNVTVSEINKTSNNFIESSKPIVNNLNETLSNLNEKIKQLPSKEEINKKIKEDYEPKINNFIEYSKPVINNLNTTFSNLNEKIKQLPSKEEYDYKINNLSNKLSDLLTTTQKQIDYVPELVNSINKLIKLMSLIIFLLVLGEILVILKLLF